MIAHPIGTPIAYPIGSNRGGPNRPRIARVVSCRVVSVRPLLVALVCGVFGSDQLQSHGYLHALAARLDLGIER